MYLKASTVLISDIRTVENRTFLVIMTMGIVLLKAPILFVLFLFFKQNGLGCWSQIGPLCYSFILSVWIIEVIYSIGGVCNLIGKAKGRRRHLYSESTTCLLQCSILKSSAILRQCGAWFILKRRSLILSASFMPIEYAFNLHHTWSIMTISVCSSNPRCRSIVFKNRLQILIQGCLCIMQYSSYDSCKFNTISEIWHIFDDVILNDKLF